MSSEPTVPPRESASHDDPVVTFITREGCHLCDDALAEVGRAAREIPFRLTTIDLRESPELEPLYGTKIPFVLIDGKPAFKYRLTAEELVQAIKRRVRDRG